MIPPRSIVGPFCYSTIRREPDDLQTLGMSDHVNLEIIIRPHMSPDVEEETFLHENLHCLLEVSGLDPKYDQEHIVSRLSPHLLRWMRDNREAVLELIR